MIIIKNGTLIDPYTNTEKVADLCISEGKIVQISEHIDLVGASECIYADGMVVSPGLIDVHSHFRDPGFTYKEDIISGSNAALAGGYTKVVCMANTQPKMDNEKTIKYFYEKAHKTALKLYTVANVTLGMKGEKLTDMEALKKCGAIGFSDDGVNIKDTKVIYEAMKTVKQLNCPISLHEEDQNFIETHGINDGEVSAKLHFKGAKDIAEISMVARDCVFAVDTKAKVNFQHISSAKSVEILKFAKQFSSNIYAEVTPQHLMFNETEIYRSGTNAKLNPPFRTEQDRLALIEGLKDSVLNIIATDHAPHSFEEKSRKFADAPSGIIGLETALSIVIEILIQKNNMKIIDFLKLLTLNPAKLYNFEIPSLSVGSTADIVIFDVNKKRIITKGKSKASNSPLINKNLLGEVLYTIIDGKIVYKGITK